MKKMIAALLAALLACAVFGCEKKSEEAGKKLVKLVYVEWSSEVASTNVVRAVLEEKLDCNVETLSVSAAAMWQSVATGDQDAMVAAWLPVTHGHYYEKVKDRVVDLGPNLEGTRIGLVVPDYVTIDSIGQINDDAARFDNRIVGIDPGAGIMTTTEKAIRDYGLKGINLVEGSGATMTAALATAIKDKRWIVVTGWTPHWMWARWKLKYLADPQKVYDGEGRIDTIVRKGLKKDMPRVYKFLDNFHWTPEQMAEVMAMNQENSADPYANAILWVNEHPKIVEGWLK